MGVQSNLSPSLFIECEIRCLWLGRDAMKMLFFGVDYLIFFLSFAESVRGCYPLSESLPGLGGARLFPRSTCVFQPNRKSPVKAS